MSTHKFPFHALLVVDMQVGFVGNMPDIVSRVETLVGAFPREHIYFTQFHNYKESLFETELQWGRFKDSSDTAIVEPLQPYVTNAVKKYGYLLPESLVDDLEGYGSVGICGVNTDICVLSAAYSLWDRGIRPYVLAEYCASVKGEFFHNSALDLLNRPFGPQTIIRGLLV